MAGQEEDSIYQYNQASWDTAAAAGQRWSQPVSPEEIQAARDGKPRMVLTPEKPIPLTWLGDLKEREVLMLAGSGGQQGPLVAAAGGKVTVLDLSAGQLKLDQEVAKREGLQLTTVQGSMDATLPFSDGAFDLIIHPCSNTFVPSVLPVWREAARVLKPGGEMLSGFLNPVYFLFDEAKLAKGEFEVCYRIPYSDLEQRTEAELSELRAKNEPFCFGHTLADQLGGQTAAGLMIVDLYEDFWGPGDSEVLDRHLPSFLATRSRKPPKS